MWTLDYLVTYDMGQVRYHSSERAVGRERVSENRKQVLLSWRPTHRHTTLSALLLFQSSFSQMLPDCKHQALASSIIPTETERAYGHFLTLLSVWALLPSVAGPRGSAHLLRYLSLNHVLSLKFLSQCPQAPLCSTGLLSSLPSQGNLFCFQWLFLLFFIPSSKDCWSLEMLVVFILQE